MSMPIAFIMCTEGGSLEKESLLMVESFRKFCGSLKDAPIYSFQVREKNDVSSETIKTLELFGVEHRKVVLNTKYPNYPLANKPLLCAYAEQEIDAEIIVFLDSDLVFFSEPKEFLLPLGYDVGIRPEHRKMIGSEGELDSNDEYWNLLYDLVGIKDNQIFVTTTVDQKRVKAFWNSGVVAVRRKAGIFTAWKDNFEKLASIKDVSSINKENFYFEQSMFSATVCAVTKNIWQFSPGYNYPIHLHNKLIDSEALEDFTKIVCVHDHFFREREWFRERIWVKTLKGLNNFKFNESKYQWLYKYLSKNTSRPNLVQIILESLIFLPVLKKIIPSQR